MKIGRKYIPALALLMVSMAGTAYAVTVLFTQTFPAIPATGLTSNCATLTPNLAGVIPGSVGAVLFDCSSGSAFGTTQAFSVGSGTTLTPTFTLPAPYADLGIFPTTLGVGTVCPTGSGGVQFITTGQPTAIVPGQYTYCADFSNAPSSGLPTFDISWTV